MVIKVDRVLKMFFLMKTKQIGIIYFISLYHYVTRLIDDI